MLILREVYARKHAMLMICMLVGFSRLIIAAPRDVASDAEELPSPVVESNSQDDPIQNLDEGISIEERIQLRRDLVQYSRAVDPSHIQIEERRQLMRKRIQERFLGSDKDNDGTISREEAAETLPQIFRHFSQVDLNDDGVISMSELEAAQAKAVARQQAAAAKEDVIKEAEPVQADTLKRKNKQAAANRKDDL
jgi:hypothetical protein